MSDSILKTIEETDRVINGFRVLRILTGEFAGTEYCYSEVQVTEDEKQEQARLSFEVSLVSGKLQDKEAEKRFHVLTGDILMAIIDKQLNDGEVIYHGGVDEK